MGWLDKIKHAFGVGSYRPGDEEEVIYVDAEGMDRVLEELQARDHSDYLGMAAEAGHAAQLAYKEGRHDDAWRSIHEQKMYYMQHANRSEFTAQQTLALDGSSHVLMANILRKEKKHDQALMDMIYSIANQGTELSENQERKLLAYFNRCKFTKMDFSDAKSDLQFLGDLVQYEQIQALVMDWQKKEQPE